MEYSVIHLRDHFSVLTEGDPTLEVYLPTNIAEMGRTHELRPCLLICPGGAYAFCSRREAEPIALPFLAEGFNVFILTYSAAPHRFPAQLREVAAAMELIHRSAGVWHCDVSRVAILGFSAGGHLAAQYTNGFDLPAVREAFPESKPVNASILCYPVISSRPEDSHHESFRNLTGHYPLTPEEEEIFSCQKLVSSRTPPTFLWHTSQDNGVPVTNSLLYAEALARAGVPFELHIFPYGGHGLATVDSRTCDNLTPREERSHIWMKLATDWLKLIFQ